MKRDAITEGEVAWVVHSVLETLGRHGIPVEEKMVSLVVEAVIAALPERMAIPPPAVATGNDHVLKCGGPYFAMAADRKKLFELRRDDRGFQVGDTITLIEMADGLPTGRWLPLTITCAVAGEWLATGHVALGVQIGRGGCLTASPEASNVAGAMLASEVRMLTA